MTSSEWLQLMQKASDFPNGMEKLILKYGEILMKEKGKWNNVQSCGLPQPDTDCIVKYLIIGDTFDYTTLELSDDEVWHWRGEDWDVKKYPVIEWKYIETINTK